MPVYEYTCSTCNTKISVIQKFNDPFPICKTCNKVMTKLISNSSFILKGGGWYADGYSQHNGK